MWKEILIYVAVLFYAIIGSFLYGHWWADESKDSSTKEKISMWFLLCFLWITFVFLAWVWDPLWKKYLKPYIWDRVGFFIWFKRKTHIKLLKNSGDEERDNYIANVLRMRREAKVVLELKNSWLHRMYDEETKMLYNDLVRSGYIEEDISTQKMK